MVAQSLNHCNHLHSPTQQTGKLLKYKKFSHRFILVHTRCYYLFFISEPFNVGLFFQSLSGTIPRSVEIELQGDLVGAACPGDVLSVTGIVQVAKMSHISIVSLLQ